MTSWNPHLYLREGKEKGYQELYLQRLVDVGRRLADQGLPVVFSLAHLASLSRTLYADLHEVVARSRVRGMEYPYRNFTIKKRSGGRRWISVPAPPLMAVQDWITQNILDAIPPHDAAMAYARGRSIRLHAAKHCAAEWVVKIDVRDFFGNISERQVFAFFASLGYPNLLSFEMARLCTRVGPRRKGKRWAVTDYGAEHGVRDYASPYLGSLPQGAPTSPALSNVICREMDTELSELAREHAATYSRYADDLYFSQSGSSRSRALALKREASRILYSYSFSENPNKTRIIPPGARKLITGLIANEHEPRVPRQVRDRIRMHLYYCRTRGIPEHCKRVKFRSVIGFRNHLAGTIEYVGSIDEQLGKRYLQQFKALPWVDFDL